MTVPMGAGDKAKDLTNTAEKKANETADKLSDAASKAGDKTSSAASSAKHDAQGAANRQAEPLCVVPISQSSYLSGEGL